MRIPSKHEMIGTLRSLLIIVGEVIMTLALSLFSIDAAEVAAGPERDKDIEETCEGNGPCVKKTGGNTAGSVIKRNENIPRSEVQPDQMTARQVFAEKVSTEEAFLRVEGEGTRVPILVIVSDYRRALEAYLSLVSTLLPEPAFLQGLRPKLDSFLAHTTSFTGSLSFADLSPSLVQDEEISTHSKQRTQRAVNREPARSLLYPDLRARTVDRARRGILPDLV